jgi:hypothetical protein
MKEKKEREEEREEGRKKGSGQEAHPSNPSTQEAEAEGFQV